MTKGVTLTIDCADISFDEARRLYDLYEKDDEHAACLIAATGNDIEKVAKVYGTILAERGDRRDWSWGQRREMLTNVPVRKALVKWTGLSEQLLQKVNDCGSAKKSAEVVVDSLREQALHKVVAFCDGSRLLGKPAKEGGKK